jgi:prephenate dehydrogenase
MKNQISENDRCFISRLESCHLEPGEFGHRAHIRAAYIYLCLASLNDKRAAVRMKNSLPALENHQGAADSTYHKTITIAWVQAVRHFMGISLSTRSANQFISLNPQLLDKHLLLTHYSEKQLFSDLARTVFVEPDIETIPLYK